MTTELRAIAERLLSNRDADAWTDSFDGLKPWFVDAVRALAEAWLAEHPADDDEPITDEWWRTLPSCWFATLDGEEKLCLVVHDDVNEDFDHRTLLVLSDDGSWGFWEQNRGNNELENPHNGFFRRLKTRGDVRRLMRALGMMETDHTEA